MSEIISDIGYISVNIRYIHINAKESVRFYGLLYHSSLFSEMDRIKCLTHRGERHGGKSPLKF